MKQRQKTKALALISKHQGSAANYQALHSRKCQSTQDNRLALAHSIITEWGL